jgi:hypothetical protein
VYGPTPPVVLNVAEPVPPLQVAFTTLLLLAIKAGHKAQEGNIPAALMVKIVPALSSTWAGNTVGAGALAPVA